MCEVKRFLNSEAILWLGQFTVAMVNLGGTRCGQGHQTGAELVTFSGHEHKLLKLLR